jgi:hypothetical protein
MPARGQAAAVRGDDRARGHPRLCQPRPRRLGLGGRPRHDPRDLPARRHDDPCATRPCSKRSATAATTTTTMPRARARARSATAQPTAIATARTACCGLPSPTGSLSRCPPNPRPGAVPNAANPRHNPKPSPAPQPRAPVPPAPFCMAHSGPAARMVGDTFAVLAGHALKAGGSSGHTGALGWHRRGIRELAKAKVCGRPPPMSGTGQGRLSSPG